MLERWSDTPFDESMLESDVVIHCPNQELVEDLFEIFRKNGVKWNGGEPMNCTHWEVYKSETCYRVFNRTRLMYGTPRCYSEYEYEDHIKCTFYGMEPDFEISDADFERIISAGVTKGGRSDVG